MFPFFSTNAASIAVGPNQSPLQLIFQLVAPKGAKADIICSEMARRDNNSVANLLWFPTLFVPDAACIPRNIFPECRRDNFNVWDIVSHIKFCRWHFSKHLCIHCLRPPSLGAIMARSAVGRKVNRYAQSENGSTLQIWHRPAAVQAADLTTELKKNKRVENGTWQMRSMQQCPLFLPSAVKKKPCVYFSIGMKSS